jgi:hypothetical protein
VQRDRAVSVADRYVDVHAAGFHRQWPNQLRYAESEA